MICTFLVPLPHNRLKQKMEHRSYKKDEECFMHYETAS